LNKELYIIAGIPAYNEEKTIAKIVLLAKRYVDEVIVVDDGSTDLTGEIANALGAVVIKHPENLGKGEAIKTILKIVKEKKPDILVFLDADGQHDPNEIPKVVEPIIEGQADIVIGSRFKGNSKIPSCRKIGLKILSGMARRLSNTGISDPLSGFRALSRRAYECINLVERGYGIEVEMLVQAKEKKLRIIEVPIRIEYATGSKTSKRSPIYQASEIAGVIIKKTIEKRPLFYLGTPGTISIGVGIYFALEMIKLFNTTRYFSIPMAFLAMGFILMGLVFLTTALIIYIITSILLQKS